MPKKELYGFEGVGAAVFLYMESLYPKKKEKEVYNYFSSVPKQELQNLIAQISTILYDTTPSSNTQPESLPAVKQQKLSDGYNFAIKHFFALNEENFAVELEDKVLEALVIPSLKHLQSSANRSDFTLSIINTEDGYAIYADGVLQDIAIKKQNLLPVLYDRIRIYHYQRNPFLVALHAGVLLYNETAFIFPGISGAGKSTLAAYLMFQEFELFSDELTIIDEDKRLTPLPLGVTLKEGSWHVMEPFVKDMDVIPSHLRFDGQKIKLISPPSIQHKKLQPKKMVFVFPKFTKGTATQFKPLSLVNVLASFIDAGYHLCDPNDFEKVFLWLEILSEAKLYALQYSDIKEAHTILKKVAS